VSLVPRTPVLVGVGTVVQRGAEPADLLGAVELLWLAVERAASDAGSRSLLGRTGLVAVPNGTWHSGDPARVVTDRIGVPARTLIAEVGITQQALLSRACTAIAAGDVEVVIVGGTEAKHRERLLAKAGLPLEPHDGLVPDELWEPEAFILTATEIERELAVPAHQYAIIERAIGPDTDPAALWAEFAKVAAANPDAWDQSSPTRDQIAGDRMIAEPYTRSLCSQWNVDQAVALVLTSVEVADAAGVPRDRWVFPVMAAGSDLMVPLPMRAELARWPAFARCAEAIPIGIDDIAHLDLYSCFPAAVQVEARELGIALESRPLTITGGMTFAGGPLNSYVLHALATMARLLRDDPRSVGLSTSVSGMLTKPGLGLWSATPPATPFRHIDVTDAARATTEVRPLVPDATGAGAIACGTVLHGADGPRTAVAVVDLPGGGRTVAVGPPDAPVDPGVGVILHAPGEYSVA
jgi:acetyl-CoA C-acetyltransferase